MGSPEEYRKNPIFGTSFDKRPSFIIEDVRDMLTKLRGTICDIQHGYPHLKDKIDNYEGFLTTGISSLYSDIADIKKSEIKKDDSQYGESISFKSRGIGSDYTNGCFICGGDNSLMNNISAFVKSKKEGERAVSWFDRGAVLDYREKEPEWIQVKIGACDNHIDSLEKLDAMISEYDVLRESMIKTYGIE
jgi:hypothetical protein